MTFGLLIKNGGNLRKSYLFSCRYKNVRDIGKCLKPHFYKKGNHVNGNLFPNLT